MSWYLPLVQAGEDMLRACREADASAAHQDGGGDRPLMFGDLALRRLDLDEVRATQPVNEGIGDAADDAATDTDAWDLARVVRMIDGEPNHAMLADLSSGRDLDRQQACNLGLERMLAHGRRRKPEALRGFPLR